jgi:ribonuclease Z
MIGCDRIDHYNRFTIQPVDCLQQRSAMDIHITFLGTGTGTPNRVIARAPSAVMLTLGMGTQHKPLHYLIDCGEGSVRQIVRAGLKLNRLSAVLITHFHHDHVMGLPGLLSVLSLKDFHHDDRRLALVGPPGLGDFINYNIAFTGSTMSYPYSIHELSDVGNAVLTTPWGAFHAVAVKHDNMASFAYVFRESDRPGHFDADKAAALGIPVQRDLIAALKAGHSVRLNDGRILHPQDLLTDGRKERTLVISGDNSNPCDLIPCMQQADVVIHQATFCGPVPGDPCHTFRKARDCRRSHMTKNTQLLILRNYGRKSDYNDSKGFAEEKRVIKFSSEAERQALVDAFRQEWIDLLTSGCETAEMRQRVIDNIWVERR